MFKKARKALHKQLSTYVFSLVTRGVTVPPDCIVNGEVTHYYTTADILSTQPGRKGGNVWIKKKARCGFQRVGPIGFHETELFPKEGDILCGEIATVAHTAQKFGKQKFIEERQSYRWWIGQGAPLYYLATMVLKGTSATEDDLRSLLRINNEFDDLWMLARLVLFNNIDCFVEALRSKESTVKLQTAIPVFLQQVSVWLDDFTVLTEFQKRVPEVSVSKTLTEAQGQRRQVGSNEPSQVQATNSNSPLFAPPKQKDQTQLPFVGRRRRVEEEYNPDRPSYFDFSHRRPAGEVSEAGPSLTSKTTPSFYSHKIPPYVPSSPPYVPQSPPYVPSSPPYAPHTPPHAPQSPPYAPHTPPHAMYPPLCDIRK